MFVSLSALHAELVACREGIRKAAELGMTRVVIDTDSMLAKMALETDSFALAPTGGVVYECKCLMNLTFVSCGLSFCPRDCNKVAHAVTAHGCKCPHSTSPLESCENV